MRIRAKLSEDLGRDQSVNIQPEHFERFEEADQSARDARLWLFEEKIPPEIIVSLLNHSLLGASKSMDLLMELMAHSGRYSTRINPLRLCLSCFWTSHYLWLMSDGVGSLYFERRLKSLVPGLRTGEEGYENARRALGLVQNHKRPVSGISPTGAIKFSAG